MSLTRFFSKKALDDLGAKVTTFSVTPVTTYCTLSSSWTGTCYKVGNWVHLSLGFDVTTAPNGAVFATIPEGYRPKYRESAPVGNGTAKAVNINTSGNINGYVDAGNFAINVTYICG